MSLVPLADWLSSTFDQRLPGCPGFACLSGLTKIAPPTLPIRLQLSLPMLALARLLR